MTTLAEPRVGSGTSSDGPAARVDVRLPVRLDCSRLQDLACGTAPRLLLDDDRAAELERSRAGLERILDAGIPVYGSTTGFGPHVIHPAAQDPIAQGAGLIAHLASGAGPLLPAQIVRATMVVRANALAAGVSGVRPQTLRALLDVLAAGIVPAVPELGSVGASGDLIPLAHIARVLTGEGLALADEAGAAELGRTVPATAALAAAGLAPVRLDARDALGLVNGTSYSTALAALAADRAGLLVDRAADLTAWLYACLGARRQAIDPRLHAVRGQRGQERVAARIRDQLALRGACPEHPERPLQEVYSVRCAAQVLGPALDLVDTAVRLVDDELAGVSDNPVIVPDPDTDAGWVALHGGNFHAAAAASAADLVTGALTQLAVLVERQIDVLMTPSTSRAPLLLASRPGAQAGLAGAQLTASAMVAEARHACGWASTMSVPTNAGNQDVVPMAPLAGRTALAQVERSATVLAVLAVSLGQYQHLVRAGLADGYLAAPPDWLPDVAGFDTDVETRSRIDAARRHLLDRTPLDRTPLDQTPLGRSASTHDASQTGENRVG